MDRVAVGAGGAVNLLLPAALLPNGHIQLGGVEMPVWMAKDALARVWEMCGDVPADVAGRIRCREVLDRDFARATPIRCWPTGSKARGANLPAIRDGNRLLVRVGDTQTAVLLDHGTYWQGPVMQLRDDSLFGVVSEVLTPLVRMSAKAEQALQIREQP